MAANKRKIQANAQKYLQKGQLDKALKEYLGLVQLDPRDSNSRLKMGDIHLRQGDKDKAAEAYIKVAEQFMKDGFDAKAVAIYKQVGKIDSERLDIFEPLAELYQRLGLTSEALAALQTAADAYNKEGRKRDALELLRKMATLDPTNTTSRLKIADLLRQADMESDALSEYVAVGEELERQGARDELVGVYERILEVAPDRVATLAALTRILVDQGPPGRAQSYAERLVAASPDKPEGHEFLAKIHIALGREDAAQDCYRTLAEVYRRTGDEDGAREINQRIFGSELAATTNGGLAGDLSDLPSDPPPQPDEAVLEQTLDLGAAGAAFSADAEQLLAEASVYLRYGKAERAIATLDALLSTEPDHRPALEKLGEAHSEHGDPAKAVAVWARAAAIAQVEGDADGFAVLRDRIASLDADAAEGLAGDSAADSSSPLPPTETSSTNEEALPEPEDEVSLEAVDDSSLLPDDMEVEIDLGEDSLSDEPTLEEHDDGEEIELDLDGGFDLDGELDLGVVDNEPSEPSEVPSAAELTVLQGGPDATVMQSVGDADATMMQMDEDEEAAQTGSSSTTTPQQIAEHLEEADFYFEQNLFDEAEALYNKVVEAAPQHPQAMVRLGEIAAKRGDDPAAAGVEVAAAAPALAEPSALADSDADADEDYGDDLAAWNDDVEVGADSVDHDDGHEVDIELDVDLNDEPGLDEENDADADTAVSGTSAEHSDAALTDPELGAPDVVDSSEDVEIDFESQRNAEEDDTATSEAASAEQETEDADEPCVAEADAAPEETAEELVESASEELAAALAEDLGEEPDETGEQADEEVPDEHEEEGDDASFDLAAELSDVFDGEEEAAGASASDTDDGFDAIFREFKKGVKEQLSDSDFEAHYDLGIAYREMGLLDDAVMEFRTALGSGELKLPSLHMLGLCALDQKQPQDAASHFEQALSLPSIPDEQQAALRYDFGRALHESGDIERARRAFQAVADIDPDYQDVSERLADLEEGNIEPPQPDVETFESFDDLIAEAESALGGGRNADEDDEAGDEEAAGQEVVLGEAEAIAEPDEPFLEAVLEPEHAETMVEAETTIPEAEPLELDSEFGSDSELQSEPESEPEGESAPESQARKRRRKKISF